ncbi:MAG: ABC transporter ATP-binding protein [Oscillospiraceae bacterium]|nr:ABC transporter ATP-binding protein [Oscillospiraceae bacterium]
MKAIEAENLTKYYKKSKGIDGVSFSVEEGDFFGFIGPNGAGKSTTIRTLLGLIEKDQGEARVFGLDTAREKEKILSRVGYMPSDTIFYSGMRVREVIELSAKLRKKDCKKAAEELCERLDLDKNKKVEALSFGNRKKVGIVCALQHSPDLCILDEPTSGLDPLMQREFFNILEEKNRDGMTVFLSSHVLSEVGRYCKNAAIIREGRVIACDSVRALGHTGVKKVSLSGFKGEIDLDGARDIKREGENVRFLYSAPPKELLSVLSDLEFSDVNISDPDLEEVFMHYYVKEGGAK